VIARFGDIGGIFKLSFYNAFEEWYVWLMSVQC
jgi:hypothetical protein